MSFSRSRFKKLSVLPVSCVAIIAQAINALAVVPTITAPIVASVSPATVDAPVPAGANNDVSIVVAGADFDNDANHNSAVVFSGTYSATVLRSSLPASSWSSTQVVVPNLPDSALTAQIKVRTSGGDSAPGAISYTYEWSDAPDAVTNSYPLALTMGETGAWLNNEFHDRLWHLDAAALSATSLPLYGNSKIFEQTSTSNVDGHIIPDHGKLECLGRGRASRLNGSRVVHAGRKYGIRPLLEQL